MINYTHAFPGSVAPTRTGWYPVGPHQRAHFDTAIGAWSEAVDEDASDDAHRAARAARMSPERAAALHWSGLTTDSHAWLAAELARA